jgi:potassium voltage-gated channel Eag-related subfamily H protein 8
MCFIIIFSCVVLPYRMVTVSEDDDLTWEIINNLVDCFFVIDMILNFNTAFFNEDFVLIVDRKEICKHYLKTWFLIDLLAIIPMPQPSVLSNS